jgi:hypothetical protein
MSGEKTVVVRSGFGLGSLLFLVLLVLKLTEQIDLHWGFVIGSLFLPTAIGLTIFGCIMAVAGIALGFAWVLDKVARR